MSAELLLRRFAQVTETPNAIARLRRFLIDLAVSSRLGDCRAGVQDGIRDIFGS